MDMTRILIVDDVAFNIEFETKIVNTLMRDLNREVSIDTAQSVAEAHALIEDGAAYDIMIIDMHLPDGTGVDIARLAREKSDRTRLSALTIYPGKYEDVRNYFDLFMKKPVMLEAFKKGFLQLL